jgi:hypothetical protein
LKDSSFLNLLKSDGIAIANTLKSEPSLQGFAMMTGLTIRSILSIATGRALFGGKAQPEIGLQLQAIIDQENSVINE